jgi:hypothetical protein
MHHVISLVDHEDTGNKPWGRARWHGSRRYLVRLDTHLHCLANQNTVNEALEGEVQREPGTLASGIVCMSSIYWLGAGFTHAFELGHRIGATKRYRVFPSHERLDLALFGC